MVRSYATPSFLLFLLLTIASCASHSPLIPAAGFGQVYTIEQLISVGADVNEVDTNGWTPLMQAAYYSYAPAVRELLGLGANPNFQDSQKWSALHYAADNGRGDIVQILVDDGANIYLEDNDGKTSRMVAQEYVTGGSFLGSHHNTTATRR